MSFKLWSQKPAPSADREENANRGFDVERGLVARYLARVFERDDLPLRAMRSVLWWTNERRDSLDLPMPASVSDAIGDAYYGNFNVRALDKAYRSSRDQIIRGLRYAAEQTPRPEPLASNVEMLIAALGLPPAAWKTVGLVACYGRFQQVEYLCDTLSEIAGPLTRLVAQLTGEPSRAIEELIGPRGLLIGAGLLQVNESGEHLAGRDGRLRIPARVDRCLDKPHEGYQDLRDALMGESLSPTLQPSDYEHAQADGELVVGVLQGAARERAHGVNILLYGPPGSGKTEFTKVAAQSAGLALHAAGEEISADGETDRTARLSDLVFALRLLEGADGAVLLFDEMEDVAWQLMRRGGSKLYLNRILETNPAPVFWTSNNIQEIDPAVLRRMTLAIELKSPPAKQRERILRRLAERSGVALDDTEFTALSLKIDATPAVLANAMRAARFSGRGSDVVERAALGIVKAISGATAPPSLFDPDFDPALTCASHDLEDLTDQIVRAERLAFSLVLSGPPGTGKSAYARFLAGKLGLEVLHKRASDLLGAYVGESEKRIAEAFEEARDANALLIFDEADSFLFDRRDAVRSWEVTQVNEMLTWMEHHPLPLVCTTNLMERLDAASLRRFTFHITFMFLDREALGRAFEVFFGLSEVSEDGLILENLTPGDFSQARRQAQMLGIMEDSARIVSLLTEISRGKPGSFAAIGFMR